MATPPHYYITRTYMEQWYFAGSPSQTKKETKKEKQARIAKQMMHDSWNTYNENYSNIKTYLTANWNKPKKVFS